MITPPTMCFTTIRKRAKSSQTKTSCSLLLSIFQSKKKTSSARWKKATSEMVICDMMFLASMFFAHKQYSNRKKNRIKTDNPLVFFVIFLKMKMEKKS